MAAFNLAFQMVLAHEGGYVCDPDDPGGETFQGIARNRNPQWAGWPIIDRAKKQPGFPDSLHNNPELLPELELFYRTCFWQKVQGEDIHNQRVAESIFDFAVNAGVAASISLAQQVAGAKQDGIAGPRTLEAINRMDPDLFLTAFALAKVKRYLAICHKRPASKKYFFGWIQRALNPNL